MTNSDHFRPGAYQLRVTVCCDKCGKIIYNSLEHVYQSRGGRWDAGIKILRADLSPHSNCPPRKEG